jgi:hypothetical protein
MYSLIHVSIHLDHPQGAYADPCQSSTFVGLSVKYIQKILQCCGNMCFRLLCVSSVVQSTALDTHNTRSLVKRILIKCKFDNPAQCT